MSNSPQGKPRTTRMEKIEEPMGPTRLSVPAPPTAPRAGTARTSDAGAAESASGLTDERLVQLFLGALAVMVVGLAALFATTILPWLASLGGAL